MRAPALLALSGLALSVAACATVEPPAPVPAAEPGSGSGGAPLPVENYDWLLVVDEDAAQLAYGLPESDHLLVGLNCGRGSGRIELVAIGGYDDAPVIVLESGGDTGRFPAESEVSDLHDALIFTAATSSSEPVLQRFRRVGWLAQWHGGERDAYAPQPGSEANIERFFAFCG